MITASIFVLAFMAFSVMETEGNHPGSHHHHHHGDHSHQNHQSQGNFKHKKGFLGLWEIMGDTLIFLVSLEILKERERS